jgi:hypothetical protein
MKAAEVGGFPSDEKLQKIKELCSRRANLNAQIEKQSWFTFT